jgi:hypothetical protein
MPGNRWSPGCRCCTAVFIPGCACDHFAIPGMLYLTVDATCTSGPSCTLEYAASRTFPYPSGHLSTTSFASSQGPNYLHLVCVSGSWRLNRFWPSFGGGSFNEAWTGTLWSINGTTNVCSPFSLRLAFNSTDLNCNGLDKVTLHG